MLQFQLGKIYKHNLKNSMIDFFTSKIKVGNPYLHRQRKLHTLLLPVCRSDQADMALGKDHPVKFPQRLQEKTSSTYKCA